MTTAGAWAPRRTAASLVAGRVPTSKAVIIVGYVVAHALLGLVSTEVRAVATVHGVVTVLVAVAVAFTAPRIDRIIVMGGYVAMCDVFWRMTRNQLPWEAAKYTAILVLLVGFVRFVRQPKRTAAPVAYFALLLPAAALSVVYLSPGEARSLIAANLAGPALLAVSVVVLRQVVASETEVARLLWIFLGPIVAVAAIATRSTSEAGSDTFGSESNFAGSGGFGPNQVSMILGLGALLCVVWALQRLSVKLLVLQVVLAVWFTGQAALTLSRGGLYGAAGGVAAIVIVALTTSGLRSKVLLILAAGVVIGAVAFPYLNAFTNGSLEQRFADTGSTNRSSIASADLDLFAREPFLGVGVGVAKYERGSTETALDIETKAHTEYTRMLGEHGVLGLVSLILLPVMAVQAVRSSVGRWNRLFAAALCVWSLLSMTHSATSIAAIGFVFGLANLRASAVSSEGGEVGSPVRDTSPARRR